MGCFGKLTKEKVPKTSDGFFGRVKENFAWLRRRDVIPSSSKPRNKVGASSVRKAPCRNAQHPRPENVENNSTQIDTDELEEFACNTYDHPIEDVESEEEEEDESRWDTVRPELLKTFLASKADRDADSEHREKLLKENVQANVNWVASTCPSCGNIHGGLRKDQDVMWVGMTYRFPIKVPSTTCRDCKHKFSVSPLAVNCFPGSAGEAWDIRKVSSRKDHIPLWFNMELLHFVEEASNEIRQFSMSKYSNPLDRSVSETTVCVIVRFFNIHFQNLMPSFKLPYAQDPQAEWVLGYEEGGEGGPIR